MKINLNSINQSYCNQVKKQYNYLKPLPCDSVSFSSMKKSGFEGIDLMIVNKFKAPIEKFNSNDDLQDWCKDKLENEYFNKDYSPKDIWKKELRIEMLNEWKGAIKDYKPSVQLMIFSSIVKDLDYERSNLPQKLDKEVLDEAVKSADMRYKRNSELGRPINDPQFDGLYFYMLLSKMCE